MNAITSQKMPRGQSLVELSLIVPHILIMLVGMIEVGFLIFNYLNAMDLTREAARFASTRNFQNATPGTIGPSDCTDTVLDYYKDTACFFVDPSLNPNMPLDASRYDDATISGYPGVPEITQSQAKIRLYKEGSNLLEYSVPTTGTGDFWYVFKLVSDGSTATVYEMNCITAYTADPPDCGTQRIQMKPNELRPPK